MLLLADKYDLPCIIGVTVQHMQTTVSTETVVLSMQAQREMLAESMTKRPLECGKRCWMNE